MSPPSDKKIVVTAVPISGPDKEASREAGRQAGQEDRAAEIFPASAEVIVEQVRRTTRQYRDDHDLVGALIERDYVEPIAGAQAAHEAAGHRLHLANARLQEAAVTLGH